MKWNRTLRWFSKYEATWSAHIDTYIIITSLLKHQVSLWRSPPSSLCVNSPWPIRHLRYWTVNTPPTSKASCAGRSQEGLLAAGWPQGEAVGWLSLTIARGSGCWWTSSIQQSFGKQKLKEMDSNNVTTELRWKKSSKTIAPVHLQAEKWTVDYAKRSILVWIHICRWRPLSAILVAFECISKKFRSPREGFPWKWTVSGKPRNRKERCFCLGGKFLEGFWARELVVILGLYGYVYEISIYIYIYIWFNIYNLYICRTGR